MQRARTDTQKDERKEAICKAAVTLFKRSGYEHVSFNGIASEAKFTKSNMYRYFSSKEEIFLTIFADLFQDWQKDYIKRLKAFKPNENIHTFALNWTNSFLQYPKFLDLTPLLFLSLEKNSSYEQLLKFKTSSKHLLYEIACEISRIYPNLQGEKAFKLLNLCYAVTSNFWSANSQNEALKEIYSQVEFKDMKPDFDRDLIEAIKIIVKGINTH